MGESGVIRGVIFDLDGVLVSTDESHYQSWKRVADDEGIPFDRSINERLRGVSRMQSLEIVLERASRSYTPDEKQTLADRKNALFRELIDRLTPDDALPGVTALLAALRRRDVRLAVASSSRNASMILDRIGLTGSFDAIVGGNDIRRSKPDPEAFLLAAERLGLPPSDCLVVEDAVAGIEAARRAGMAVVGIGAPETLPGVTHLVEGLDRLSADRLLAISR